MHPWSRTSAVKLMLLFDSPSWQRPLWVRFRLRLRINMLSQLRLRLRLLFILRMAAAAAAVAAAGRVAPLWMKRPIRERQEERSCWQATQLQLSMVHLST